MAAIKTAARRQAVRAFRALPFPIRRVVTRFGTPNYTVGAVILVRDPDARLLLARQPPLTGWALPGGLLRKGEGAEAAALRELREECGLRLTPAELRPATPNGIVFAPIRQVDMAFTTTVPEDAALRADGAEVTELSWFPPDGLPQLTMTTARILASFRLGPYRSVEIANAAANEARTGRGSEPVPGPASTPTRAPDSSAIG